MQKGSSLTARRAWLAGAAFVFALPLWAQSAEVPSGLEVSLPVLVSGDRDGTPHVEPYLAADPADPDLLIGAAVVAAQAGGDLSEMEVSGFRSTDGGRSWARFALPACQIDPWVAFGRPGRVYVTCLGREPGALVLYRSEDGGATWSEPVDVPHGGHRGADRPVVAVAPGSAAGPDTVYVAFGQYFEAPGLTQPPYTLAVSVSRDAGRTFTGPYFLRHDNLDQQPFDAEVLPDGTLVTAFMDYLVHNRPLRHRRTWISTLGPGGDPVFRLPTLLFEQRGHEMPWSMAADAAGRLYVAVDGMWTRRGAGPRELTQHSGSGLYLVTSSDRGQSWSDPVAVLPPLRRANIETPAVAVNGDGVVALAWYDTRHDASAECFDLYATVSTDGGQSFRPAVRFTPETSCPRTVAAQRGIASRWSFGGDYSGLAAGADGRFHLFWADSRQGVYQVWSAVLGVE